MSNDQHPVSVEQVRTMQIIVFALAMGVVTFALVMVVVVQPKPAEGDVLMAYVAAAFAAVAVPFGIVMPRIVTRREPPSVAMYQTKLILGAAVFEGAAFFNLIAYMLEGQIYSLAIAGVLLMFILSHFPTVSSVQDWIASRERQTREAEAFGRQT